MIIYCKGARINNGWGIARYPVLKNKIDCRQANINGEVTELFINHHWAEKCVLIILNCWSNQSKKPHFHSNRHTFLVLVMSKSQSCQFWKFYLILYYKLLFMWLCDFWPIFCLILIWWYYDNARVYLFYSYIYEIILCSRGKIFMRIKNNNKVYT